MPFQNARGRVLMGVGGGYASVDNRRIEGTCRGSRLDTSGAIGWLNQDSDIAAIAGQLKPRPDGWADPNGIGVFAFNATTGELTELAQHASTKGFAGGGKWAAYIGTHGWYGSLQNLGAETFLAADIGPDGRAVYAPHAGRPYHWLDTGALLHDGLLDGGSLQLLGGARAVASAGGRVLTFGGLRSPQTVGAVSTPRYVQAPDGSEWLLCYAMDQGRILLHPWDDASHGYVIWDLVNGPFYGYSVIPFGAGLRVAGASERGEQPGELRLITVDLHAPRVALNVTPPPPLDSDLPPDEEPEKPMPVDIPNQKATVERIRAKYPSGPMDRVTQGRFLHELALAIGEVPGAGKAGLHKKGGSNSYPIPGSDQTVDGDLILFPNGQMFDVLGSEETESTPSWHDEGVTDRTDVYVAVVPVIGGDGPDPGDEDDGGDVEEPEQPQSCPECAELKAQLAIVRSDVKELEQVIVDAAKAANERLTKLEQSPTTGFDPARYYAEGSIGVAEVLRNEKVTWQIKERK